MGCPRFVELLKHDMPPDDNALTRYPVPDASALNPWRTEFLERKSRFLTQSCRCASVSEARAFVAIIREKWPDATHNCFAFVCGPPGDPAFSGCSDDGEPRNSAGKPMLQALLYSGVGQICAVVTRWFGGIKLGVGGLSRAYQTSVRENLATLPLNENRAFETWKILTDYRTAARLTKMFPRIEASVEKSDYNAGAEFVINLPSDRVNELTEVAGNVAGNAVKLIRMDGNAS